MKPRIYADHTIRAKIHLTPNGVRRIGFGTKLTDKLVLLFMGLLDITKYSTNVIFVKPRTQ